MMSATDSTPLPQLVPLTSLRDGECGTIENRDLCCEDCELLTAMGLTERCRFKVCRRGEPFIVQVASTRLGLSAKVARRIMVLPDRAAG